MIAIEAENLLQVLMDHPRHSRGPYPVQNLAVAANYILLPASYIW